MFLTSLLFIMDYLFELCLVVKQPWLAQHLRLKSCVPSVTLSCLKVVVDFVEILICGLLL